MVEKKIKKVSVKKIEEEEDSDNISENEDIDIENLTSNKISKSIKSHNDKKLYVILEHAYFF